MTASRPAWPMRRDDDRLTFHFFRIANVNFGARKNLTERTREKYAEPNKLAA
jgi:hypothetical protein